MNMEKKMKKIFTTFIFVVFLCAPLLAQGLVAPEKQDKWPKEKPRPRIKNYGIQIKSHDVSVEIKDQVAITTVKQVFCNPNDYPLRATYLFALPAEASINNFKMTINGKEIEGKILEKSEAQKVYTDLIRKSKNVGLLEYFGRKSFKAEIYPLEPKKDTPIEIKFTELLTNDNGLIKYYYPLNTSRFNSLPVNEVKVSVKIKTTVPMRAIYSPSHKIKVTKADKNNALVEFGAKNTASSTDFTLYYSFSTKDFAMNAISYHTEDEDGYFMLMVTPKTEFKAEEIL